MKYGIIMVSRNRADIFGPVIKRWCDQDLPLTVVTEPDQTREYRRTINEIGIAKHVRVVGLPKTNAGIGHSRAYCTLWASKQGYKAFIMADDDAHPRPGDNVRKLLRFVAEERAVICAGWMPPFGLWIPNGNELAHEPNVVVPIISGDRIYAANVDLVLKAGNFNPSLTTCYENAEIARASIKSGHLWYTHTGVHTRSVGKRGDEGGIISLAGSLEARKIEDVRCHQICHDLWPKYVTEPPKKYSCQWRKMVKDLISPRASEILGQHPPFLDTEVKAAFLQWKAK